MKNGTGNQKKRCLHREQRYFNSPYLNLFVASNRIRKINPRDELFLVKCTYTNLNVDKIQLNVLLQKLILEEILYEWTVDTDCFDGKNTCI